MKKQMFIILFLVRILRSILEDLYCNMDRNNRIDCSANIRDLTQEKCENELGCCYGELENGSIEPWCFNKTVITTIPTTIPSTIPTTIPTTILTTIPTTILTTIPTTIPSTIPSTILTTIPTTILTTIFNTFPTKETDYGSNNVFISNDISELLIEKSFSTEKSDNFKENNGLNLSLIDINNYNKYFNYLITSNRITNNNDNLIKEIREKINSDTLDIFISNIIEKHNKDLIIDNNKIIYQLTSSFNQNNNDYNNI